MQRAIGTLFFLAAFDRTGPEDWIALSVVSELAAAAYGVYGLRTQRKRFGAAVPSGHSVSDISFIIITFGTATLVLSNALGLITTPHQAAYLFSIAPGFFTALPVFFRAVSGLTCTQAESARDEP